QVDAVRSALHMGASDAFVMVGGPKESVDLAVSAIQQRLRQATEGVPAETRAATPDGQTVYLRPRPGSSRMYPETDIPPIIVTKQTLSSLENKIPKPWEELVKSISTKYSLNQKLANQVLDSDYFNLFEEIARDTRISPTFVASKLTEDIL